MTSLNETFSQNSEKFIHNDIPFRATLNGKKLNYSVKSLKLVDRYLELLFEKKQPEKSSAEYENVVIWCGAYIGEVIRRNAATEYHWIEYADYMKGKDENIQNAMPYMLATQALLYSAQLDFMTLPLNKVTRYLNEGKTHSVYHYANGDLIKKKR